MAVTFSADEIFEVAQRIERNGARFYRKAANGIANKDMKKVLEELAAMEVKHESAFAAMREELAGSEQMPAVFDPDDEVGMYLCAMADGKIFDVKTDPSEQLKGSETIHDILNKAITMEKDSIVFYLGLEEYVPPESGKNKVREIIKQEMGHLTLLTRRMDLLK